MTISERLRLMRDIEHRNAERIAAYRRKVDEK